MSRVTEARLVDLLRWPLIGRALRWRWGRLLFQLPLLLLAGLVVYDGLTGPQLAPLNLATVLVWIHYRGGVILLLVLAGNLFCMGCPFALLRTVAPSLARRGRRWPRPLRHKWGAVAIIFAFLWLYEWLDLWASPQLTAWLVVGYLAAGFALEFAFAESPFCKYLCPLGAFNSLYATAAPLMIAGRDLAVCRACANKECVNGSASVPGCGTELYVPQIRGNLDCLLCLDCARACPHDNVALTVRRPGSELAAGAWRRRWDLSFLTLMLAYSGVSNALGMVPPIYTLEETLARWLNVRSEGVILLLIFAVGNLVLPTGLGLAAAALGRAGAREPLRAILARHAPAFVPLGLAIWLGHYLFHFATGALTVVPVLQTFLLDHGIRLMGGEPNWTLGAILPATWLLPLQILAVLVGLLASLNVLGWVAAREGQPTRALLPWFVLLLGLALAAVYLFTLPMEMRGTVQFTH